MCDASSFPPTLHSDITKSTTKTYLVGWLGPPHWCAWAALATILLQVNPVCGTPRGQPPGLKGPPGPSGDCPSSYCSPLRGLFPCHVAGTSLSCSSLTGRTGSWPNRPMPRLFNPSEEEQMHFRLTIKRKFRLSLKELPEASPSTQSFHQLRVERAQT